MYRGKKHKSNKGTFKETVKLLHQYLNQKQVRENKKGRDGITADKNVI